ncbi:MAG TPA: hypothetical protein PKC98_01740 [Candidatus Melainabacteria bacterium]|nr:hypothetical protein [Candidatus Melainabacteria bacterium]
MTQKPGDSSPVDAEQAENHSTPRPGHPTQYKVADSKRTGDHTVPVPIPGVEHPEAEAYYAHFGRPGFDQEIY